jgi:hypothetical protein
MTAACIRPHLATGKIRHIARAPPARKDRRRVWCDRPGQRRERLVIAVAVAKRIIAWKARTGIEKLSITQNTPTLPRIADNSVVADRIRKTCNITRPIPSVLEPSSTRDRWHFQ